jgi:hypothetical protein
MSEKRGVVETPEKSEQVAEESETERARACRAASNNHNNSSPPRVPGHPIGVPRQPLGHTPPQHICTMVSTAGNIAVSSAQPGTKTQLRCTVYRLSLDDKSGKHEAEVFDLLLHHDVCTANISHSFDTATWQAQICLGYLIRICCSSLPSASKITAPSHGDECHKFLSILAK